MAEKKLEVKDLRISFRTSNGKVQAVRDISFDLYKGETLAIVGESGSGKSVTSRAIMGILAGNAIVEGGKILYGDKDLMTISEDEFHNIRGDKIAMVFQDPLSSLNPIMRVGAQLTEAMLLKNKASRRESKKAMNELFEALSTNMTLSGCDDPKTDIDRFKQFELKHCELQSSYMDSLESAREAGALAEHLILVLNSKNDTGFAQDETQLIGAARRSINRFVVHKRADELNNAVDALKEAYKSEKKEESKNFTNTKAILSTIAEIENEAVTFDVPNTFTLGYYLTFVGDSIPDVSVEELNKLTHKATDEGFMFGFMDKAKNGVIYSSNKTDEARRAAISLLRSKRAEMEKDFSEEKVKADIAMLEEAVIKCLDPLDVVKDSLTHTFKTSIENESELFFTGSKRNEKEEKRFKRETAKYEAIKARGKVPEWAVIPASYIDLDLAKKAVLDTLEELAEHFEAQLKENASLDFSERTLQIIDELKEFAQNSVYKLSKSAAKEKAVKLMESVGIDNPRHRFRQYPFEFSGGMRQRVVIAIALTANPDILICDEPTTALDVTIQAQILELINKLKEERHLSVIFITHDLGVVANMADRIAVMYAGKIVEYGTSDEIFYDPAHPYTWALLASVPDLNTKERLESIPGTPPNMIYPPKGDAFAPRNKYALEIDFEQQPPMFKVSDSHYAATWLRHPSAPKIDPPPVVTERIKRAKEGRGERA